MLLKQRSGRGPWGSKEKLTRLYTWKSVLFLDFYGRYKFGKLFARNQGLKKYAYYVGKARRAIHVLNTFHTFDFITLFYLYLRFYTDIIILLLFITKSIKTSSTYTQIQINFQFYNG